MKVVLFAIAALLFTAQAPMETTVTGSTDQSPTQLPDDVATSVVTKKDLERRMPRSTPDALRYEPGVFVQQTAHGQASTYLRGLTGQQTVMLFDGIRLNNSTYRQGPNQYFFTLDLRTIASIEVQRGGASTRFGADALGGAINAQPLEPTKATVGQRFSPSLLVRGGSADGEVGGRAQIDAATKQGNLQLSFLGGVGARRVGLLHGPPVLNPDRSTAKGELPWVPRYGDNDTQLGTGFNELTADGRLVLDLDGASLTAAGYLYQQREAPRTDQCPAPSAPADECLTYEEQFRALAYVALKLQPGRLGQARLVASWQQQHERRRLDQTSANRVGRGVDDVDTIGLSATWQLPAWRWLSAQAGADSSLDFIRSSALHTYTDTLDTVVASRGQYLDGSRALTGGVWANATAAPTNWVSATVGGRVGWSAVFAPSDPSSSSQGVERAWAPVAAQASVSLTPLPPLRFTLAYDRSYRAPNLDDMTSRQQTGPGFQFENSALTPELAHTFELGARLRLPWLWVDAWVFETVLDGAVLKVSKTSAECPANTPQCRSAWTRFQLENAPSIAEVRGAEASARLLLPGRVTLRASASYTWSEGPRVGGLGEGVYGVVIGERVPLSRTPPLNGTVEAHWSLPRGLAVGAALQWAAAQERLALQDYADGRIPLYGTPAFAVVHLRASWRPSPLAVVSLALENLLNTPFRFHGSSVNGAGRSAVVQVEFSTDVISERTTP